MFYWLCFSLHHRINSDFEPNWICKMDIVKILLYFHNIFAFVLQRALGLRTALTDRSLFLLRLSANVSPYGIFSHRYRG